MYSEPLMHWRLSSAISSPLLTLSYNPSCFSTTYFHFKQLSWLHTHTFHAHIYLPLCTPICINLWCMYIKIIFTHIYLYHYKYRGGVHISNLSNVVWKWIEIGAIKNWDQMFKLWAMRWSVFGKWTFTDTVQ